MKKILFACAVSLCCADAQRGQLLHAGARASVTLCRKAICQATRSPISACANSWPRFRPRPCGSWRFTWTRKATKKFVDPTGSAWKNISSFPRCGRLRTKNLSIKDFAEVKKGITKAQEQLKTTLKKKINSVLGKTGDGSMSIGDIDTLGVFDSSDTSLSFMAVMDQVSRAGGQREVDKQAVISSYLLAQGKLVIVNQYQILNPAENMAEQLGEAKAHAQEILKELNIDHSVPWASYLDSFAGKLVLAALIGGLIGGVIGWVVNRKKKKAGSA